MAYMTEIFEWEGDSTQPFDTFNWKGRLYNLDTRMRLGAYGMIFFDTGNFDSYNAEVAEYDARVATNLSYLSAGRVIFDQGPHAGWPVGGLSVAGTLLALVGSAPSYTGSRSLTFKVYVDGSLYASKLIYNERPFRVPAPKRSNRWEFELQGNVNNVKRLVIAPSMQELKHMTEGG